MANFLMNSRTRRSRTGYRRTKKKLSDSEKSRMSSQCKKHPKHRQSPGVCSLCLNEKLSKLSLDYYDYTSLSRDPETVSSSSSAESFSSVSSYNSSSCLSPLHHRYSEVVSNKKKKKKDAKKFLFRLLLG